MQAPSAQRTALIKLIHVARRDLERAGKMDEPTYRTMLRTAGQADSTTKMDVPALKRVLEQAKKAGFKVRPKAGDRRQDTSPEARKVRALWLFLYELGIVKNPAESALALYVKRIAKVDDLHWADGEAMLALIETLKKWAMRFLPAAVASLEKEARALALGHKLNAEQLVACQHAHDLGNENSSFDRHWAAWAILTTVVGRLVPPAVKQELGERIVNVERRTGEKRNDLLSDTVALVERILTEHEASPATAAAVANAIADRLASHWGGQVIYFPTDFHWKLARIELEIYDAFTGNNHVDLARRYGMTDSGLRRLINRVRSKLASHRVDQQLDMLDPPRPE